MTPTSDGPATVVGTLVGTLVVYGTYECLHCRRAWPAIVALAAGSHGALQLDWRHFAPPGAFPHAAGAAAAVEAAALQGGDAARRALHDALLVAPTPLWPETVAGIAAALGLDVERLERDARHPAVRAALARQADEARAQGVRATPTIHLHTPDGTRTPLDARDAETLRTSLDAARLVAH